MAAMKTKFTNADENPEERELSCIILKLFLLS
jgi:hypothetical protein